MLLSFNVLKRLSLFLPIGDTARHDWRPPPREFTFNHEKALAMRKAIIGLMAGLLACGTQVSAKDDIATMEKKFKDTPKSQRLSAYWYWISGNISKDGVVKDLRAMNEAGINRVQIGMTG